MSGFYGDLIVPDVSPLGAERRFSAGDLAAGLEELGTIAASLGVAEIWGRTSLIGSDSSRYLGGPPGIEQRGVLGVSMAWACLPGIGFYRDTKLALALPSLDPAASPREQALFRALEKSRKSEFAIRGPEVDAIRRIAAAAAGRLPFPVLPAIDIQGSWAYDFEVAYRRRLAYAFAFEASMAVGTLAPFKERYRALTLGALSDLAAVTPAAGAPDAFSIALNLLAVLDEVRAYESAHQDAAPTLPGRMQGTEPKRDLLATRLEESAVARSTDLASDGRAAIQALLEESRQIAERPTTFNGHLPLWGRLTSSKVYQGERLSPEDT